MALGVVADTNVYVSIFQFGERMSEILDLAVAGSVELCISEPILEELRGVLTKEFQWSTERAQVAADTLRRLCRFITPRHSLRVAADPDDDRILECAIEARADVIISGDRDLLLLNAFRTISIMSQAGSWIQRPGRPDLAGLARALALRGRWGGRTRQEKV